MSISKNEIIEALLKQFATSDTPKVVLASDKDESGESEWEAKTPQPLQPQWVNQFAPPPASQSQPVQQGESEWSNHTFEEEAAAPEEGHQYNPDEKLFRGLWHPERRPEKLKRQDEKRRQVRVPEEEAVETQEEAPTTEPTPVPSEEPSATESAPAEATSEPETETPEYSDEEYFEMVKSEPEHIATNLMLQRKAPYNQFKYVYPLAKALLSWMDSMDHSPKEGTALYDETVYMLDIIEQEAERKKMDTPEGGKSE